MIFSSPVPPEFKTGTLLPEYLAARFTYHSLEQWTELIDAGKISRDGSVLQGSDRVASGEVVSYDAGEFEEPAANLAYRIIYEDEWLLGIDKPGNLLVHRAGKSVRNNLIYQLRYVHAPLHRSAHSVHRLDRDTSGVILVVKETAARASFGQLLLDGKLYKSYLAVVEGAPQEQEIDLPIGEIPVEGIRHKFGIDPKGKTARTRIVACRRVGERHSLATVEPITGRTHQIRVHLAAIGAPIVGDKLYSFTETEYLAWLDNPSQTVRQLPIDRHALHCASLSFVHPYTQKECRIEAELPRDMQELIARLSG